MSCPTELQVSMYVDSELAADAVRELESHLVQCRDCRGRVLALREEADLLCDALQDRPHRAPALARHPTPAHGLALGLAPALGLAVLATLAVGWVAETSLASAIGWLNPFTLQGALDMAFDLVFLVRDEAPAAFEFAVAIASMATASALLTFALTAVLRRWSGPGMVALAFLALVAAPPPSHAHFGMHEHEDYTLAEGETHDGTLIVTGDNIAIDGVVAGDLLAIARSITVRGEVRGNILAGTRSLEIRGKIDGSVYSISRRTDISGEVRGNLYAVGQRSVLSGTAKVGQDMIVMSGEGLIEGRIERDLYGFGERVELRGDVERNVDVRAQRFAMLGEARVGGDVSAQLPEGAEIEVGPQVEVKGETTTGELDFRHRPPFHRFSDPPFYLWLALHVGAGLLAGFAIRALLPGLFAVRLATLPEFFRSLGVGFAAAVAVPLALCLGFLTLVGAPLAAMGAAAFVSAVYAGFILLSSIVGSALVHPRDEGWMGFGLTLLVGLSIVVFATHLPFVGGLLWAITALTGLGLVADRTRTWLSSRRRVPA